MNTERFLKYLRYELNYSVHTVLSYSKDLFQFVVFLKAEDDFSPASVAVSDVRSWVHSMTKAGMAPRTIRRKIQSLRSYYRYLQKYEGIVFSPVDDIPLAKIPRSLPVFVPQKNMDAVLDSKYDHADFNQVRNHLMVEMLYETGMRRAELISLNDCDVDVDARELKVLGKRNKHRLIPFGDCLAEQISEYRSLREEVGPEVDNFFITDKGKAVYPTLVYRVVTGELASETMSKRSPHVLRHSFASAMLNNGAELNSVKELLGHESLAATQVYTHVTYRELKQKIKLAHPRALKKGG